MTLTSCMYILSFPSCEHSCWLCSSRILIRDSSFSLCSRSIFASLRISASEERGGTTLPPDDVEEAAEPELSPLVPLVEEDEEAFRCWYSSCRVAFSDSSSLEMQYGA